MISKVFFYNFWHNGDLHLARGLIKRTVEILKENKICNEFEYFHSCNYKTVLDIPGVIQKNSSPNFLPNFIGSRPFIKDNALYINTWVRSGEYMSKYGLTFDCLYFSFKDCLFEHLGIDLSKEDPMLCFPEIDYSKYDISKIKYDCERPVYKNMVLVCNNNVESLQSHNFSFDSILGALSVSHPNSLFVITNYSSIVNNLNNVFFFEDLFPNLRGVCNLNEISYFANYCKVIVGRASGPFTFCFTKDKLFDSKKSFISFSLLGTAVSPDPRIIWKSGGFHKLFIGNYMSDKIDYLADVKEYNVFDHASICSIISTAIEK
jgi:hypothetical protein